MKKRIKLCVGMGFLCLFLFGCVKEEIVVNSGDDIRGMNPAVEETISEEWESREETATIRVHICGQVLSPGVYELPGRSRVYDAIQAAGGITEEGDGDYLNQAGFLEDGMKITVPSYSQVEQWEKSGEKAIPETVQAEQPTDPRIDINTADIAALCTLPGIGESRARSIIAYREENGPFTRIEDIMKVSGIKEAAFAKIKDQIKVS
ncbi:MAG: helix-hairpin-helix domain-containing protein [Lachnospiraceae bacterium]